MVGIEDILSLVGLAECLTMGNIEKAAVGSLSDMTFVSGLHMVSIAYFASVESVMVL